MKLVKKEVSKYEIEVGDLVEWGSEVFIIAYKSSAYVTYVDGVEGVQDLSFPYFLVSLKDGPVYAYRSLNAINHNSTIKLLSKNKNVTVSY